MVSVVQESRALHQSERKDNMRIKSELLGRFKNHLSQTVVETCKILINPQSQLNEIVAFNNWQHFPFVICQDLLISVSARGEPAEAGWDPAKRPKEAETSSSKPETKAHKFGVCLRDTMNFLFPLKNELFPLNSSLGFHATKL